LKGFGIKHCQAIGPKYDAGQHIACYEGQSQKLRCSPGQKQDGSEQGEHKILHPYWNGHFSVIGLTSHLLTARSRLLSHVPDGDVKQTPTGIDQILDVLLAEEEHLTVLRRRA